MIEALRILLKSRWRVFSNKLGGAKGFEFAIDTGDSPPVRCRAYRMTPENEEEARRQTTELVKRGLCVKCQSPYCTNPVFADKKDGSKRMALDYRELNVVTVRDEFPVPRIDDILDAIGNGRKFTTLDMR